MRVESSAAGSLSLSQRRTASDRQVQAVFSQVLADDGIAGYQSAAPIADSSTAVDVRAAWSDWYRTEQQGRYQNVAQRFGSDVDLRGEFGDILANAQQSHAYIDPKSFLSQLSSAQLTTIQHVHSLAEPISVANLSDEGALNLLLPPAAQIDLNRDGITKSGIGSTLRFPDSTTPAEVVQAWDEATADLPPGEKMLYELQVKLPVLLANIELAPDGSFVRQIEPGDPDFRNPQNNSDYSYVQMTQDWLDYLDAFKNQIGPVRYQKDTDFWQGFQAALKSHGAP